MKFKYIGKVLFAILISALLIRCSKENSKQKGYYSIKTLTNTLDIPIKLEIGRVTKKISGNDLDYTKNLVFKPFVDLQPKQTFAIDSNFVCIENCELLLNEGDPEMEPIFLKLTLGDKIKIDTNCNHIYVLHGLIERCRTDEKNYFNNRFHSQHKDNSGNIVNEYIFDSDYLDDAK